MIEDKDRPIFGILREMIDRTAKIQVCDHKTGYYEDFKCIEDVTHDYDNRSVFGIGLALNTGRYAYAIEVRLL